MHTGRVRILESIIFPLPKREPNAAHKYLIKLGRQLFPADHDATPIACKAWSIFGARSQPRLSRRRCRAPHSYARNNAGDTLCRHRIEWESPRTRSQRRCPGRSRGRASRAFQHGITRGADAGGEEDADDADPEEHRRAAPLTHQLVDAKPGFGWSAHSASQVCLSASIAESGV